MSYLLAVFAIWTMWQVADYWVVFPPWVWPAVTAVLGVGAKVLLDGWHDWYLGIGLGGLVLFVNLLANLILLATDGLKSAVLRNSRGR